MVDLAYMSLTEAADRIRRRDLSPVELTTAVLKRIEEVEPRINAYITVTAEEALAAARTAETEIAGGRYRGPLHGIPVAVKDVVCTAGVRTTAGSRVLRDFVPNTDAAVVVRLREAGAVIVGKTNTHEFAAGITTNNPFFGPTRNPWNVDCIPGGSSGGSGAALAAGLCTVAIGTDTGGSIRIPAACCGVVGLKPTYGRVSRQGIFPLAWSQDHCGPMARSVADAALLLQVIAGYDPADPGSANVPVPDFSAELSAGVSDITIGLPRHWYFERVDPEVAEAVYRAVRILAEMGARVMEVDLPALRDVMPAQYVVCMAEAAAWHVPFLRSQPEHYSPALRGTLEGSLLISAVQYLDGLRIRARIAAEMEQALGQVDVLAAPTIPLPAPPIGQEQVNVAGQPEPVLDAFVRLNAPANQSGLPAISIPCGFSRGGLPIGLQIIGRPFDESTVIRVAHAYEQVAGWHRRPPPLV
ncbi:amidase [Caldinitratiruptor microaerophilus]|uniref:Amidase n=1 Tax=Caldinitratiruptor microaerophilus TaxID=671077 RepID=A0AA35CJ30_9FIRM|nr:amidase [Caldinitratiruptor microaerophilus]BDG60107.1 amidase [Caldinitratiruptor microaerophilus]